MAGIITTPVELGFSEFVSKLIADTFEAIITSSVQQEEDWMQMNELLGLGGEAFARKVIGEEALEQEVALLFPSEEGGTVIRVKTEYQKGNPKKGIPEVPPVYEHTGYQPTGRALTETDVAGIYEAVRQMMALKQYELLKRLLSRGATKVIVDAGRINAKLTFEINQVEEEPQGGGGGAPSTTLSKIFVKNRAPVFKGIARPIELEKVHFFVKPPSDKDPQTHQVKANVYSEVEIQFKTIT